MGREGIEGYSDKTRGRAEINPEDRHDGPIAPECSEPRLLGRGAEQLLLGETHGAVGSTLWGTKGNGQEGLEGGRARQTEAGVLTDAPVVSAALGFTSEVS